MKGHSEKQLSWITSKKDCQVEHLCPARCPWWKSCFGFLTVLPGVADKLDGENKLRHTFRP